MSTRATVRTAGQGGFVLVAVLAMLVVLALLAGAVALVTQRLRDDQVERQRLLQDEIAMAGTRATLLYLLSSQRVTFGGLTVDDQVVYTEDQQREADEGTRQIGIMAVGTEISLDGRAHRGLSDLRFSMQDDRGLLGVNWVAPVILERWLGAVGGDPSTRPVGTLSNLLLDYQDADDLYRINSVEAAGYASAGLPPPSNQTIATPLELRRVVGWRDALAGVPDTTLVDTLTVARSPTINVNTAPVEVLASLPGLDRTIAERVVAARELQPFSLRGAFRDFTGGLAGGDESVSLYPSTSGTLKLWSPRGGAVQVLHWTMTPLDDGGRPWREDYEFTLPQDGRLDAGPPRTVASPLFADPAPAQE